MCRIIVASGVCLCVLAIFLIRFLPLGVEYSIQCRFSMWQLLSKGIEQLGFCFIYRLPVKTHVTLIGFIARMRLNACRYMYKCVRAGDVHVP